jgi:hypothetical protein
LGCFRRTRVGAFQGKAGYLGVSLGVPREAFEQTLALGSSMSRHSHDFLLLLFIFRELGFIFSMWFLVLRLVIARSMPLSCSSAAVMDCLCASGHSSFARWSMIPAI